MTSDAPGPAGDSWQALAHLALLDHVNRGDARHALEMLLSATARHLQTPCRLRAEQADGSISSAWRASPRLT